MMKTMTTLLASAAIAAMAAGAVEARTKACFIYVGPIGDFGWSYQHDRGRLDVEKEFGDAVETAYLENVRKARIRSVRWSVLPAPAATLSSRPHSATWMRPTRSPASSRM